MKNTKSLNENHVFRKLYHRGKSGVSAHIAVYVMKNRLGYNRLGITTTKKIGNAVERNRARRLIYEAYRLSEEVAPTGCDIVIVARKKAIYSKMQDVRKSMLYLFDKLARPNNNQIHKVNADMAGSQNTR